MFVHAGVYDKGEIQVTTPVALVGVDGAAKTFISGGLLLRVKIWRQVDRVDFQEFTCQHDSTKYSFALGI